MTAIHPHGVSSLEFDELAKLYQTNSLITHTEELELEKDLPNPNDLIVPSDFQQMVLSSKRIDEEIEDIQWWRLGP